MNTLCPHDSELAKTYREKGYWRDQLIVDYLEAAAEVSPSKTAITDNRFGSINYEQLLARSKCLAVALHSRGISSGDRFVIALPNWQHVSIFMAALSYIGAIGVHMPILGREHEFGGVLRVSNAKGIVVPTRYREFGFVEMVESIAPNHPALSVKVSVGDAFSGPDWIDFDALLKSTQQDAPKPEWRPSAEDITSILFTSGSSGDPKGVVHNSNTLFALNTTVAPIYQFDADDIIFMAASLGFSAGLIHGPRLAIYLGATLVLQESWDAALSLNAMVESQATFTLLTPTLLHDLMGTDEFETLAPQLALKVILCGGSNVPKHLLHTARTAMPNTHTSVIWGMTEGIGCGHRFEDTVSPAADSDGQAFLGTELRTIDATGKILSTNDDEIIEPNNGYPSQRKEGELIMRGPQRCMGYFDRPDLNKESFMKGGWFRTGDVATIDERGYLNISGRQKDIIIRGGANISPAEIETALSNDPSIAQIAIVAYPDERLGERLCACVVPTSEATVTLDDIKRVAGRTGLAKYKWPERLEILESLPMTAGGKVIRGALQELVNRLSES